MNRYIFFGALAAAAMPAAPALAISGPAVQPVVLQTSEVDLDRPGGAIEGILRITISPDGIVQGYFRPDDSDGRLLDVHGGLTGKSIYLDIGGEKPIVGTYEHGTIVGYRGFESPLGGFDTYRFTAVPSNADPTP